MAICENCSTSFTPSDAPTEVTSLRILCAKCEAERKAERARRAAEKAGRPAAASAAPPVPATRRAAPAPTSTAAPVSTKPAASPDAAPRPARPSAAAPAPIATSAASAPPPRPPSSSKSKARGSTPDVRREIEMLKARENKVMMYGWIACGVLAVIALGVWWNVQSKRSAETARIEAAKKESDDFLAEMKSFDVAKLEQANKAIALAESKKPLWDDTMISGDVGTIVGKAKTNLEAAKDRGETEARMATVEESIQNAASKTPKEIATVRRTLKDMEDKTELMGPEFKARVAAARAVIDKTYVIRLHDDAKAIAAKGPSEGRSALTAYTLAEEEVLKLFEDSMRRKNKEAEEYYRQHFKDIITESDLIATALFTPEVIDKVAWKDLLAPEQAKSWANDGLKGFRIENGALQAVGPEIGASKIGIMSIGDREQWRDFELDAEFTLVSGNGHFFFRLGKRTDNAGDNYPIAPGEGGFKLGEKYGAKATFIGSKLGITWTNADIAPYGPNEASWSRVRKGAFGVTLTEGSEIKFTRLRIRELR